MDEENVTRLISYPIGKQVNAVKLGNVVEIATVNGTV